MENFKRQIVNVRTPELLSKWSAEVLEEGFIPFPKKLLRCMSDLFKNPTGLDELSTILAIIDYKRPNLSRPPSAEFLAFLLDKPVEHLIETINSLVDKGLVTMKADQDGLEINTDGLETKILEATLPHEPLE